MSKNKKFLIIIALIGLIITLGWMFKRWYFVYKCNALTGENYGYSACYYIYNGEWATSTSTSIWTWVGGVILISVIGFLVFSWMYIPQKIVSNLLNRKK